MVSFELVSLRSSLSRKWVVPVGLLLFVLCAVTEFRRFPINHDVAMGIDTAARMFAGERLYVDLPEVNPPMYFYLGQLPVAVSEIFGLELLTVVRGFLVGLAALSLLLCRKVGEHAKTPADPLARDLLTLFQIMAFLYLPGYDNLQREHLMTLLIMPWLISAVARANGVGLPSGFAFLTGAMAGIGFAIKPFFLPLIAGVEIYLAWQVLREMPGALAADTASDSCPAEGHCLAEGHGSSKGQRFAEGHGFMARIRRVGASFLRPETLGWGLALAGFLGWVFLGTSYLPFLETVKDCYLIYNSPWETVFIGYPVLVTGFVMLVFVLGRSRAADRHLHNILAIAVVLLLGGYLLQKKGWLYHGLPVFIVGFQLLLLVWLDRGHQEANLGTFSSLGRGLFRSVVAAVVMYHLCFQSLPLENAEMRQTVRDLVPVFSLLASDHRIHWFGTSVFPVFPTVIYSGIRTSQAAVAWMVGAIYEGVSCPVGPFPYHLRAEREPLKQLVRRRSSDDLRRTRPILVVADVHEERQCLGESTFDFIEFLSVDPVFRVWFAGEYRLLMTWSGFRFFIRRDSFALKVGQIAALFKEEFGKYDRLGP